MNNLVNLNFKTITNISYRYRFANFKKISQNSPYYRFKVGR